MLWKKNAANMIAKAQAANIPTDPLLTGAPQLSEIVSVVDSVKKQHGLLIEAALLRAINCVPGWTASKSAIQRPGGGIFKPDCYAFNSASGVAYVFECKRNYASLDGPAKRDADQRLDEILKQFPAHAAKQSWTLSSVQAFILSFYGRSSGSKHTVHDQNTISSLFPPCVVRFVRDYMEYTEYVVGHWAADRAYGVEGTSHGLDQSAAQEVALRQRRNVFVSLDELVCDPEAMLEISEAGITIVK